VLGHRESEEAVTKTHGIESLSFGAQPLNLLVVYGSHDNFRITVHPDLRVVVDAPLGKASDEIHARIKAKAAWIFRQLSYFEQYLPRAPKKRYVSGETFRYLGRPYRLKVRSGQRNEVKLVGRFLYVTTPVADRNDIVKELVDEWYSRRAAITYENRLMGFTESNERFGIEPPRIRVRRIKGRWGSCNGSTAILLNTELVKAPSYCIDYVIAHELCHLRYRDHGPKFQRLLSRMMPDWRYRKERLERVEIA
jgi:predicted metal-dependent hydrolase